MPYAGSQPVPGSFLTEEQRKLLDYALAEKAQEDEARAKEVATQQKAASMKARGAAGGAKEPKKGGAGGKFTWGTILDGTRPDNKAAIDKNDPNYDSDEERTVVLHTQQQRIKTELQVYKEKVEAIVAEYFSSGDVKEVANSLEDLGVTGYMFYFVKRLITLALDRSNREREMASQALSSLYADVIPPDQVQRGFTILIDSIGDLVLDCPEAPDLLAMFIARAVVDDVLPPAIAHRVPNTPAPSQALKHKLEQQLSARHGAEKVLRCWGSGAGLEYQETKEAIGRLLQEFAVSRDVEEAARCLRSLHVPFFYHEAVKQAILMAMEASSANPGLTQALIDLLARLAESGEVSIGQLSKGLSRVAEQLDDLCLDNPAARAQHAKVMEAAESAGLLDSDEASALRRMAAKDRSISVASITSTNGTSTPNSEAEQETKGMPRTVGAFKAEGISIIREFFDSSDVGEVGRRLQEFQAPGLMQVFVKQAVVASLDRKDRERELVSQLLTQLHPSVLSSDQVAAGFTRLLAAADDLVLDCPDVVHLLALFLGRAIVDEVLPPAFLTQVLKSLRSQSLGVAIVRTCGGLLSARHGAERLSNAWHGGALSMEQVKGQFVDLLKEFSAGAHDASEAARCLTEIGARYYHHQLVKSAIELSFAEEKV